MRSIFFAGVNLGGESTLRTSVAILELREHAKRVLRPPQIILRNLFSRVGGRRREDADEELRKALKKRKRLAPVAINAPLELPPCFTCSMSCKGSKTCADPAANYLRRLSKENARMVSRGRKFLPYIHRPCDAYVRCFIDPGLSHHEPMGSNNAPVTARGYYLRNVLLPELNFIESYPALNLIMLRRKFKLLKSQVVGYNSVSNGKFYRKHMMEAFESKCGLKVEGGLREKPLGSPEDFSALVLGYVAVLHYLGETCEKPTDFPPHCGWIVFPEEI